MENSITVFHTVIFLDFRRIVKARGDKNDEIAKEAGKVTLSHEAK